MTIRQMLRKLRKDRALIDQAIHALEMLENKKLAQSLARRTQRKPRLVVQKSVQKKKNGTEGRVIPFSSAQGGAG